MSSKSPPFGRSDRRPQVRYSPALGKLICERIAAGQSEASLGREPGMPSVQAIYKWRAREPGFAAAYEAAQDQARRDRRARDRAEDEDRRWRQALRPRQDGRRGRVSTYTDELGGVILRRIAAGETVLDRTACPADRKALSCRRISLGTSGHGLRILDYPWGQGYRLLRGCLSGTGGRQAV